MTSNESEFERFVSDALSESVNGPMNHVEDDELLIAQLLRHADELAGMVFDAKQALKADVLDHNRVGDRFEAILEYVDRVRIDADRWNGTLRTRPLPEPRIMLQVDVNDLEFLEAALDGYDDQGSYYLRKQRSRVGHALFAARKHAGYI